MAIGSIAAVFSCSRPVTNANRPLSSWCSGSQQFSTRFGAFDKDELQICQAQPRTESIGTPQQRQHHAELHIDCFLDGSPLVAFADTGANFNAISPDEVIRRGLSAVPGCHGRSFSLPNGEARRALGSVNVDLGFRGDDNKHNIQCEIVANLAHPLVLSFPTLVSTGSLQHHKKRLRRVLVPSLQHPPLRFLEAAHQSTNRVRGFVGGAPILAVPDTGSSLMCMSEHFVRESLPDIRIDPARRQAVRFADGSSTTTLGTVRAAWQFDPNNTPIDCAWHVITGLQAQAILSLDFVQEHEIFSNHTSSLVSKDADAASLLERSSTSTRGRELFGIAPLPQGPTKPRLAKRCCDALLRMARSHSQLICSRNLWRSSNGSRNPNRRGRGI
ncbi:hypothetical protein Micbo1qcDRAFT_196929 [Microdochium bolleyi]|uniref:Aspartic peptidase domain-containing protein n=1 Tax=Microdochium bolleyi TaxID=196109 RepID=A0A136IVN1_9PEZI|nr:hypothetical protein Micbo1qcDRAFT_196929 [Microdochium bolleyi]